MEWMGVCLTRSLISLPLLPLQPSTAHCPQLLKSLSQLVHSFLYHGHDSKEGVFSLFPSDFHSSLRSLLTKLLLSHLAEWRETLLQGAVGPAKLVGFGRSTQ